REVRHERFRKDLYFRLAVIVLDVPPLRERGTDVLLLTEHFLRVFNAKYGKAVRDLSGPARDLMRSYPWPGNVRELSHVIERAVLWSRGPTLDVEHLSLTRPVDGAPPPAQPDAAAGAAGSGGGGLQPAGAGSGPWGEA